MVDKDHAEKFEEAKASLKSNQSELEEAAKTVATTGEEATAAKTVKQEKAEALQTAKKEAGGCGCHVANSGPRWSKMVQETQKLRWQFLRRDECWYQIAQVSTAKEEVPLRKQGRESWDRTCCSGGRGRWVRRSSWKGMGSAEGVWMRRHHFSCCTFQLCTT